jgi:hypothetical protein
MENDDVSFHWNNLPIDITNEKKLNPGVTETHAVPIFG